MERNRWENGEDPPQVRRAVDRYAAALLMPRDVVRSRAEGMDLGSWRTVAMLADQFQVSKTAMRIRMEEVGLIYGVDNASGRIVTEKPPDEQMSLL
jgi:Zn-dependent peptidase ImmA (M78 family)